MTGVIQPIQTLASNDNAQMMLVALVGVFALIGVWSTLVRIVPDSLWRGPMARNLFLGVGLAQGGRGEWKGHVLALGSRGATVVSPRAFGKGEQVTLSLAGVANFPGDPEPLVAEVVQDRVLRGSPDTHILTVRFRSLSPTMRTPLLRFVHQLARDGRLSHA